MKDAFGGILNIVLITVFLVIVSGLLAMTVNYTKAFRMKNAVISAIEQYEGYGCFDEHGDSACIDKIKEYAEGIGYHPTNLVCNNGFKEVASYFCYNAPSNTKNGKKYYSVVTQVDVDMPIVNRIMGFSFFQVHGDTRYIEN